MLDCCPYLAHKFLPQTTPFVGFGFECFYCYVNKLKPNRPNTINFIENGFKNWALLRIATTGHDRK